MRTSTYLIDIALNGTSKHMLIHGYTGAIDVINENIAEYLVNHPEFDKSELPCTEQTIMALEKRGYITEKTSEEEFSYVRRLSDALFRKDNVLYKCFTCLILFFCLCQVLQAQKLVTGQLKDNEKNELVAATVRCYRNDTIFVQGTKTNGNGEFTLNLPDNTNSCKILFTYLGYKDLAVKLNIGKEKNVRMGEVLMNKDVAQLQEVTVLGENIVQNADKMMIYPSKEQLRHSYDGYSALEVMMVPGVRVDMLNAKITYMNENVMLCVNGREATQEEVQNLNAKDIQRVDFYSNGMIEYPEANSVINFVLKKRDYAGSVGVTGNHRLNLPKGSAGGTLQYFQGKSEYAISIKDSYENMHLKQDGLQEATYHYPQQDIVNTRKELPSHRESNKANAYFNYLFRDKMHDFYSSVRLNRTTSTDDAHTLHSYNTTNAQNRQQEYVQNRQISPSLKLRHVWSMAKNQKLRTEFYGSYGDNSKERWYDYRSGDNLVSSYSQNTNEHSWFVQARINYTKIFSKQSSFNVEAAPDFTHTSDYYLKNGKASEATLDNSNTRLYATYIYKIKNKLNLQAQLAGHWSYNHTSKNTETHTYLIPSFKVSYFHRNHSLKSQLTVKTQEPGLMNRTSEEIRKDEFSIHKGNPDLRESLNYNWTVDYAYTLNRLSVTAGLRWYMCTHTFYNDISYDNGRNSFIYQKINGGNSMVQLYKVDIQYQLIPRKLIVGLDNTYGHQYMALWKDLNIDFNVANIYVTALLGGWKATASYANKHREMEASMGAVSHIPSCVNLNIGYSIHNWNFNVYAFNPFYKSKFKTNINREQYTSKSMSRTPGITGNILQFSVNYRFSFGRKKHKFDQTEVEDVNKSTIL